MPRRAATAIGIIGVVVVALVLSGCAQQDGLALAREACKHVNTSIQLYRLAESSPPGAQARNDLQRASDQLQQAEPLAAQATSADGQWNALMTTLQEIGRVDERYLLSALRDQCGVADSNQTVLPPIPTTFPPVPGTHGHSSTTAVSTSTPVNP